jgi:hypothetical protein
VGEVESRLPWLEVSEGRFACPSGAEVSVSVIASGRKLPVEGERSARALRVITNRGDAWAAATATLIVPALVVAPEILDFGQVPHDQVAQAELVIANQGGGEITGAIKSAVAWLSVTPAQFRIGAEGKQVVRVRFHGDVAPAEASEVANVLSIDSDLGQVRVAARWRWAEPGLLIAPNALDWGERTRDATAALALTITNTGTAALEGKIVARGAWLSAKPSAFTCAPGQALTASVRANLNDLPPGRTALNEALVIESNAGRWSVPAAVFVLAPEIQIRPLALDLGEIEWGDVSSAILRLANHGTAPLTAQITSLFPWLHAEVDEITCPPGESVRVTVEARSEEMLRGGQWPGLPGLRIESDAGTHEVDITLLVYKPELQVTPEYLDFGVIPRQGVGQVTLTISNPGTASLGWALSSDALWLELTADQGVTMPGESSQVNLYAYGLALPEEDATVLLTIESDAGEIALRGAISIARPQLWVAPPLLIDLGVSVNRAAVEDVLSLFNRGVGDLTGTVRATVPWLSAAPSEFRIGTGGQQPITVRALPEGLREGETLIEGALEIVSDAGSEVVDVRLEVELSGQLVIETPQLTWALGETPPLLLLRNAGQAPIAVAVRPQAKWLWVNHERLAIKPGRTAKVEVNVDMAALPATSPVATEIILDEGGRIHRIAVAINRGA